MRPTGDAAYRDGTGTFHPAQRRVVDGADLHGDTTIAVDVCVIGAGAGGARGGRSSPRAGMRVVVLEEGRCDDADRSPRARAR